MREGPTKISKMMSYVLRHRPDAVGVTLDEQGWVGLNTLVDALRAHKFPTLSLEEVQDAVATDPKQRYTIEGERIRANQGHSVQVDLAYDAREPPEALFHGTALHTFEVIKTEGIRRMSRHHVHLSEDLETATKVGRRHGQPIVLLVRAGEMHRQGRVFFRSTNQVWLTEHVPASFISEL
jgi:putative RNA 2'-phosphotransferase